MSFLPLLLGRSQDGREQVLTAIYRVGEEDYPMRALRRGRWLYIFNAWSDGQRTFVSESTTTSSMRAIESAARTDPSVAERVHLLEFRTPEELYDVEQDPYALTNLAGSDEVQTVIEAMRGRLRQALVDAGDPLAADLASYLDEHVKR